MYSVANAQRLILGSGSPRRSDLLSQLGIEFEVQVSDVDEIQSESRNLREEVLQLAADKAAFFETLGLGPETWVLTADTLVGVDGSKLAKPRDVEEAKTMLSTLSGRTHEVWTASHLMNPSLAVTAFEICRSEVTFRELSKAEIHAYAASGEGSDKAGAYGIQAVGASFVSEIQGSYSNVVGLPLSQTLEMLMREGVIEVTPST